MYLKNIEIQGFKSFANKIVFKFHNGITGIVGPNGSGKSNVADAVRWVLGEQRIKQLRGASMQDVIFSGTEMRKPLGYAFVAITLDNSDHQLAIDFDEVTVARRIYRSGESEYLLNGAPCRLKDVNELFYDTGIGKEGYSIIGQGQIDKILSGKPEERRELFDEAAGIVKFKKRKVAAQKKLEDEKQNLIRVKDILSELEKQIGPLEKQSQAARIYLKKREELKNLDVNMFLLEHNRLKEQLRNTREKFEIADDDLSKTTRQYEQIKEEYEQIQGQIEELEETILAERTTLSDTSVLRGKLEGEINVLREQIKSAKSNEEHFRTRKETVTREMETKLLDKEKILEDKKVIDSQVAEIEKVRNEAREKLLGVQRRIEELSGQIEADKNMIIEALNVRATIRSKLGRYDTMTEQVNIRKAELTSRLLRIKSDEEQQEETIKKLQEEFEAINQKIHTLNDSQEQKEEALSLIREELAGKDQKLRDTQVSYHQEKSKLDALTNLTERYEGYGGSVKKVMEAREQEKGIVGVVADIIKVEKKYETAIETALGGNIQNIVTDDEETAKRMIAFLKQTKAGRATFLPLTSIMKSQEFKNKEVLKENGVVGLADSVVTVADRYKNVAKSLLGRIVVVDNIDNAVRIARKYHYSIRMVTLEGELFTPGGAISGGAYKNSSNLLGRRREMEELSGKVKKYLKEVDVLLNEIEATKERRNKLRLSLEEDKAALQRQFIEQNTARLNVIKAQERRDEASEGSLELKEEQQEIEEQIKEIRENKLEIQKELEDSELLEKKTEQEIRKLQTQLEEKRREESEQSAHVSEWDVEVEKMLQQQEFHQQNVDRIDGEIGRLMQELSEIKESLQKSSEDTREKESNIVSIEQTIEASRTTLGDTERKLKEDVERKENLSLKQKNFFKDRETLAEKMGNLDKEVYRLNSQQEKFQETLDNQINYMWDEYEITLSDAAALRNEELTDLSAMKKEIASLKEQIKKLGDVNVNAIEDYRNLMERFTFLKTQHDDLVEAEKTLEGIIVELDSAMRKQFHEKFAEIGKEFDKVFKELFGGGKGTLELMEDEDILEAGIRIIAQPPGKKLQNMMQLSGGEKALTAIALLFAIQNLKPSPFCLLDEIEAALDENNVGRFAKYLHKLTKNTQFIVITHRRGTMEKADRLYGITMQEKGVSTLVSVNLIDKELDD
ncbi:chromosome segregation protein SMC [Parablautia intestinalis]|uniref:Chromosome partition protein Smc n=1 Tax=Parablautia intestinalis TaxID=2320100 RepID=A0A3A9API1_9FIRM|nr:chromosome segregation protein SMC [Parablautia intestinalis]RKI92934.1 chromosome segregation protein SMC [Parablautia intestinalis]